MCGTEFNTVFPAHRSPASEWSIAAVASWCVICPGPGHFAGTTAPDGRTGASSSSDSPQEQSGLELSVPRQIGERLRDFVRDGVKRLRGAAVSSEHLPASTDITDQSELDWENVLRVLSKADMTVDDIVKVTQYLTRAEDIKACSQVRNRFLHIKTCLHVARYSAACVAEPTCRGGDNRRQGKLTDSSVLAPRRRASVSVHRPQLSAPPPSLSGSTATRVRRMPPGCGRRVGDVRGHRPRLGRVGGLTGHAPKKCVIG